MIYFAEIMTSGVAEIRGIERDIKALQNERSKLEKDCKKAAEKGEIVSGRSCHARPGCDEAFECRVK